VKYLRQPNEFLHSALASPRNAAEDQRHGQIQRADCTPVERDEIFGCFFVLSLAKRRAYIIKRISIGSFMKMLLLNVGSSKEGRAVDFVN
jgi:hypothetical protein